jgi:hypothetical protein
VSNANQYVRRVGLLLTDAVGNGLDLSQFRIVFNISAADVDHPNSAAIRVYNLSAATVNQIRGEFQQVTLQAGYEGGAFGIIFLGTIKQFRVGKENPTTSYLDILAADGDVAYNNSTIAVSLAAGSSPAQHIEAAIAAMQQVDSSFGLNPAVNLSALTGGIIPADRGKVMFGMPRDVLRSAAARLSCSWSIHNNQLQVIPYSSYLPGEAVVLSQATGVIGIPESTDEGIKIKCLLNPKLRIGGVVQLDNDLINQTLFAEGNPYVPYNQFSGFQLFASTAKDGLYRIYCIEYEGDTRGQPWYCNIIALAISPSTDQVITNPSQG